MPTNMDMALRVLLLAALGAAIGYQRKKAGKPAGLRTHTLICVGAALFTVVSIYGFGTDDTARVVAGIMTGIGFLGAGAIMHSGAGIVARLTTAATVWSVSSRDWSGGWGWTLHSISHGYRPYTNCIDYPSFN